MKKYIISVIILILVVGGFFLTRFYRNNLRGVKPAITDPAPRDVPAPPPTGTPPRPGTNTTGIPLTLPDGFSISIFAENIPGARAILFDPSSRMIVSQTKQGKVVALPDENVDGQADSIITLATGLRNPHGLEFNCEGNAAVQRCTLFVAEEHQVITYDYEQGAPKLSNRKKIIDLPSGGGHYTRTLQIINTSEGKRLLTSIGSSCNVCKEQDARRAAIYVSNLDGSNFRSYATGLRNSVFMRIHPVTGEVWATEMGRDLLGDNTPPEEVNIIKDGGNYGWPICYSNNVHDTQFDRNQYIQNPCNDKISPHIAFQAHSAPLGLAFIPEEGWPENLRHDLLIAYHGSWNRSTPTGYKIVRYDLDNRGTVQGQETDFLTGFLKPDNKSAYGRPVDLVAQPGGILYISDDHAGLIYRMWYQN